MSAGFIQGAVLRAVLTYQTIAALEDPVSAAAFGYACGELMQVLNVNLQTAATLLRAELDRRHIH